MEQDRNFQPAGIPRCVCAHTVDAEKVFLEISDTGGGIEKENLSKIFDPFFTTKGLDKGTGLGLSTSYGIVKENGGHISIKNTGPEGTTFLVELPLYKPVGLDRRLFQADDRERKS